MKKPNDQGQFPNIVLREPPLSSPRPSNHQKATGAVAATGGGIFASRAVKGSQGPAVTHLENILTYLNSSLLAASPSTSNSTLFSEALHASRTVIIELTNNTAGTLTAPLHDVEENAGDTINLDILRDSNKSHAWCENLQGSDFIYTPTMYTATVRHIISIAFILVMVVTVIGNSVIIIIVITDRPLRRITSGLVVSMAVADILMALCGELQSVIMMLSEAAWAMSDTMCELFTSADLYFSLSEMLHITCLAGDRYLAICHPFKYERIGRRYFIFSLFISWSFPAAFSFLPILLHWHHIGQEELYECLRQSELHVCSMFPNIPFSTVSFLAMYAAPTALMCYCYSYIYRASKSQRKRMSSVTLGAYSDVEMSEVSPLGVKPSDASFLDRTSEFRKMSTTGLSMRGMDDSVDSNNDFVQFVAPRRSSIVSRRPSAELDTISLKKYDERVRRGSLDKRAGLNGLVPLSSRKVSISEERTVFELTPFEELEDLEKEICSNDCKDTKCCSDVYTVETDNCCMKPLPNGHRERSDTQLTEIDLEQIDNVTETTATQGIKVSESVNSSRKNSQDIGTPSVNSFPRVMSQGTLESQVYEDAKSVKSNVTCTFDMCREDDRSSSDNTESLKTYSVGTITHPPRKSSSVTMNGKPKTNGVGNRAKEPPVKKHRHSMFRRKRSLSGHRLGLLGDDFRAARSICIVFLCYTITWSPYWFIILIMPYVGPDTIPDPAIGAGIWLAYFGSALNPFVYYFSNTNVKKGIKRLIRKLLHKHGRHTHAFRTSFP